MDNLVLYDLCCDSSSGDGDVLDFELALDIEISHGSPSIGPTISTMICLADQFDTEATHFDETGRWFLRSSTRNLSGSAPVN